MTESPLAAALHLLVRAADAVRDAVGSAGDADLIAAMTVCEGVVRRLDGVTVDAVAAVERRGAFTERGYTSPTRALSDLLGWEAFEARRRVVAAEQVAAGRGWMETRCRRGFLRPQQCSPTAGRACGTSR